MQCVLYIWKRVNGFKTIDDMEKCLKQLTISSNYTMSKARRGHVAAIFILLCNEKSLKSSMKTTVIFLNSKLYLYQIIYILPHMLDKFSNSIVVSKTKGYMKKMYSIFSTFL